MCDKYKNRLLVLKVEAEAGFEGHGGASEITCIFFLNKSGKLKYAIIFSSYR